MVATPVAPVDHRIPQRERLWKPRLAHSRSWVPRRVDMPPSTLCSLPRRIRPNFRQHGLSPTPTQLLLTSSRPTRSTHSCVGLDGGGVVGGQPTLLRTRDRCRGDVPGPGSEAAVDRARTESDASDRMCMRQDVPALPTWASWHHLQRWGKLTPVPYDGSPRGWGWGGDGHSGKGEGAHDLSIVDARRRPDCGLAPARCPVTARSLHLSG